MFLSFKWKCVLRILNTLFMNKKLIFALHVMFLGFFSPRDHPIEDIFYILFESAWKTKLYFDEHTFLIFSDKQNHAVSD